MIRHSVHESWWALLLVFLGSGNLEGQDLCKVFWDNIHDNVQGSPCPDEGLGSRPSEKVLFDGRGFFAASHRTLGRELHWTDGRHRSNRPDCVADDGFLPCDVPSSLCKGYVDIMLGTASSNPRELTLFDDCLFFVADAGPAQGFDGGALYFFRRGDLCPTRVLLPDHANIRELTVHRREGEDDQLWFVASGRRFRALSLLSGFVFCLEKDSVSPQYVDLSGLGDGTQDPHLTQLESCESYVAAALDMRVIGGAMGDTGADIIATIDSQTFALNTPVADLLRIDQLTYNPHTFPVPLLFFSAADPETDLDRLYRSDLLSSQSLRLLSNRGPRDVQELTVADGWVYLSGEPLVSGGGGNPDRELWRTNGHFVFQMILNPGPSGSHPFDFTYKITDSTPYVYFLTGAQTGMSNGLFRTQVGGRVIENIATMTMPNSLELLKFKDVNGGTLCESLYFAGDFEANANNEVWLSDGRTAWMLCDVNPHFSDGSCPGQINPCNDAGNRRNFCLVYQLPIDSCYDFDSTPRVLLSAFSHLEDPGCTEPGVLAGELATIAWSCDWID